MSIFSFSFDELFDLDDALSMPLNSPPNISPLTFNDANVTVTEALLTFPVVGTPNDVVCSVCTEGFEPPHHGGRQIPCGHVYHTECIATWLSVRDSCPLCRVVVVEQKIGVSKKLDC